MAGHNPYRQQNTNMLAGLVPQQGSGFFGNALTRLSKFSRRYGDAILTNAKGIHANEERSMITDSDGFSYARFSSKMNAIMQEKTSIASLSADYATKLPILQEYAKKGDISTFVTKMTNELIVYGKNKRFCDMVDMPKEYPETVRESARDIFDNIYDMFGFNIKTQAWDICRDWLVEGYISYEIIYDDKRKNIIGFQKLDPRTLMPISDPETKIIFWLQTIPESNVRRLLIDAEVIYISYAGGSTYMETSYVEPLIRPYNELKSIERSRLMFNLINATMHKKFGIPTTGLSQAQAEQEIATLIADYKDYVVFDDTTGEIYIDGSKDLPYSKEYWFPKGEDNSPEMEILQPGGADLNESDILNWFKNAFKDATKFPLTRLDKSIGGGNIYMIGGDMTHDDKNFDQFIDRVQEIFKEILVKPLRTQLCLNFPELEKKKDFDSDVDITFYGNSEIIEAKALANLQAKVNIVGELQNAFKRDEDKSFFHHDFLAMKYLGLSEEDLKLNEKMWQESPGGGGGTPGDTSGGGGGLGGGDMGGDLGDMEGGDMGAQPDLGADDTAGAQPEGEAPTEEPVQ